MGPCLFLVYINDLPAKVQSDSRLFADDTAVDREIKKPPGAAVDCVIKKTPDTEILQTDLTTLEKWEAMWDMAFHAFKCTMSLLHAKGKTQY